MPLLVDTSKPLSQKKGSDLSDKLARKVQFAAQLRLETQVGIQFPPDPDRFGQSRGSTIETRVFNDIFSLWSCFLTDGLATSMRSILVASPSPK